MYSGDQTAAFAAKIGITGRRISHTYDGLERLIGTVEAPGNSFAYTYDLAGNRTAVQVNGAAPAITTYNLANQITNAGYSYDNAGNLANDGTTVSTYDALHRMTARGGTTYAYNGDGTLVSHATGGVTTRYTQDLASPLTQVLQTQVGAAARTDSLFALGRIATLHGSTRTWYVSDALGSVRRTVSDAGVPLGVVQYDPWGSVESGTVPTFGFTGELQQGGDVYLRARWYTSAQGRFGSVDPAAGAAETPYSLHPYQYAYSAPTVWSDPSGEHPNKITSLEGIYIGALIALTYVAGDLTHRRWEFPIPGASRGKKPGVLGVPGYADMLDFATGEVYEIKPRNRHRANPSAAIGQLQNYIRYLHAAARRQPDSPYYIPPPTTGVWVAGTSYLATNVRSFGLWPLGIDPTYNPARDGYFEIRATLSNDDGIIVYWGEKIPIRRARVWVPSYAPETIVDAVEQKYRGQRQRRVPDFGRNRPIPYPGLNVADPGYWCDVVGDALQYYLEELARLGELLGPTSPGDIPAIPGPDPIPPVPI